MFTKIALALQFLHVKGIAHMDLKPQNLLLSGGEVPLLKVAGMHGVYSGTSIIGTSKGTTHGPSCVSPVFMTISKVPTCQSFHCCSS